ncbi:MAG: polysaccharide deacetylase family protein [Oligoflexia bacterium]|nr:polysaccharide deacetylase family protein [Oligoflexia bacterium]
MSVSVCFYFQVHQPFRLRKNYNFFSIGPDHYYEDDKINREILYKIIEKSYIPTNNLMLKLIKKYNGQFKIAFSISGIIIEQLEKYAPYVLDSFRRLVDTGCVEIINETYYHSLCFLKSKEEFKEQVTFHKEKMKSLFGVTPTTFRNTELIYNNELAVEIEKMGYKTILAEGVERVLGWRSPNFVYYPSVAPKLKLLLKNYRLSDDVAFRFSNGGWPEYPLTADKYANWLHAVAGNGEVIGLFMDYETFGEHQWADTGIFKFLEVLPEKILAHPDYCFQTPAEAAATYPPVGPFDSREYISWADIDRDLSAWLGNPLQDSALDFAYSLEKPVKESRDPNLIHTWRKLLTSDHYYYACTKWFNDGDVHKYFNPYDTPYEAYMIYINVLNDLKLSLRDRGIDC